VLFSITKETELSVEIKDIRGELSILQMGLNEQWLIFKEATRSGLKFLGKESPQAMSEE
jgi:hypothetical protein